MHIPDSFARRLHDEFDGRLRVRWSVQTHRYVIEQKVGRAALPPYRIDEGDDHMIRARDGYAYVLEVTPGDRIPCEFCGLTIKVPHLAFKEVRCNYCKVHNPQVDARWVMGYWPLEEPLLQHLRRIRPERSDARRAAAKADAANRARLRAQDRSLTNYNEAAAKDTWAYVTERQQIGYGTTPQHSDKGLPAHD